MKKHAVRAILLASALGLFAAPRSEAQTLEVLAMGKLDGTLADLSNRPGALENGVAGNLLGGMGSALTYASGNIFLALPDRGPNAVTFNASVDNTVSYINRFHTLNLKLVRNTSGTGLPFTLTPVLQSTTLLWSPTSLAYGTGAGLGNDIFGNPIGSGAPTINTAKKFFFTGRSDNLISSEDSGAPNQGRFDPEGLRVSKDGRYVYISDEYGPHVYEFERFTGKRTRSFELPATFYVATQSPVGANEVAPNSKGRVDNQGMEGLAITPDGQTLVGIMQNSLLQDGGSKGTLLRIVTIDIHCGCTTHQYGYLLTSGSGVSEINAINDHEFLVDERDGTGREAGGDATSPSTNAKVKQLFKIDLNGATDISFLDANVGAPNYSTVYLPEAMQDAVQKKPFLLDIVASLAALSLGSNALLPSQIPAKIEGVTFGPDLREEDCAPEVWERFWKRHQRKDDYRVSDKIIHTLWIANDNDFLPTVGDLSGVTTGHPAIPNPNQFFVFGFFDDDLPSFVPEQFESERRW